MKKSLWLKFAEALLSSKAFAKAYPEFSSYKFRFRSYHSFMFQNKDKLALQAASAKAHAKAYASVYGKTYGPVQIVPPFDPRPLQILPEPTIFSFRPARMRLRK
jgi:hypothetical protein